MKLLKKIAIGLFVIFVTSLFLWAIFSPKDTFEEKVKQTLAEQKERADLRFVDVTFSETMGGIKYWELDARTASFNKDQDAANLITVDGRFYENNVPVLKFISPKVFWNMQQKEITIQNPLGYDLVTEKDLKALQKLIGRQTKPKAIFNAAEKISGKISGAWFKANQLNWKLKTKKLFCDSGIVFNRSNMTIYANNLAGDVALNTLSLTGDPTALLIMKDNDTVPQTTTVKANEFSINSKENRISAVDQVRVTAQDSKITAQRAHYAGNSDKLILSGRVKVMHKDILAHCQQASFFPASETIVLEKRAWAIRGQNEVHGEKITINLKDAKISVAGKTKTVISDEEFNL